MTNPQPSRPVPDSAGDEPAVEWQRVRQLGHDINNLLGIVVGYSEILVEDSAVDPAHASDLARILESARRAAALVDVLMTHARDVQSGQTGGVGPTRPRSQAR